MFEMKFPKPLILVLDGINEVDSQALIVTLLTKMQSLTPIKLFLTSRPMKIPPAPATSPSSVTTCFLHEEDTHDDIRAYVENVVRNALPDDAQFQNDTIDQVLAKASRSFLWVKLALETLQDNWHSRGDGSKVLTEVPDGMELLYQRMLDVIKAQSPRLHAMAKRTLTWAICCWRPLSVAELQLALQPEFQGFVQLENTIIHICGHLISVDESKISLVHTTARRFLPDGRDNNPPFIDPREGHEHLATVCLKYLCDSNWRMVLKSAEMSSDIVQVKSRGNRLMLVEKDHPLLRYAVCYWAYHVSKSSTDDIVGNIPGETYSVLG